MNVTLRTDRIERAHAASVAAACTIAAIDGLLRRIDPDATAAPDLFASLAAVVYAPNHWATLPDAIGSHDANQPMDGMWLTDGPGPGYRMIPPPRHDEMLAAQGFPRSSVNPAWRTRPLSDATLNRLRAMQAQWGTGLLAEIMRRQPGTTTD